MDIITAHQQGLIEQLEEEVAGIVGRARHHGQRAIVLHHLFDHSRGAHEWALAEARRELRIARGFEALAKRVERWGWLFSRRQEAARALAELADAIGERSRARCASAYLAYRLSATPALRHAAEERLPLELLLVLDECHEARRRRVAMGKEARSLLAAQSELQAQAAENPRTLQAAWTAIETTRLGRSARRLVGDRALARGEARDRKRRWDKLERELRNEPGLPASFRANPAQHFYALQLALAERRRQRWREICDREPNSFELAA